MNRALVCLCLTEETLSGNLAVARGHTAEVDLVEVRADFLRTQELPGLAAWLPSLGIPAIVTVRRRADGGHWIGSEEERLGVLRRCVDAGSAAYVDLEEDVPPRTVSPDFGEVKVIRSFHDTAGVPVDLIQRIRDLSAGGRFIAKAAVTTSGCSDVVRVVEACGAVRDIPSIVLGMGEWGVCTRVLATRLGSYLTYCSAHPDAAAPGHFTPGDLDQLYRFRRLEAGAPVYGVIGNPIAHSASPRIHNTGLSRAGLDGVYLSFRVDDLEPFFALADLLELQGVSVTVPHKLGVISHLKTFEDGVKEIGACNTLVRRGDGWHGANTDWEGFLRPLRSRGIAIDERTRAAVIGSGGAARAVAYALKARGARTIIAARSRERGEILAREMGGAYCELEPGSLELLRQYSDLVVQCSSCGMEPNETCDPVEFLEFEGHEVAYDLVYRPEVTQFLGRAKRAGCRCIGGMEMLLAQAHAQFEMFTGRPYPAVEGEPGRRRLRDAE